MKSFRELFVKSNYNFVNSQKSPIKSRFSRQSCRHKKQKPAHPAGWLKTAGLITCPFPIAAIRSAYHAVLSALGSDKNTPPCRCSPISNLHDSAGGFSVWHVCASNVRVYPGGLLLDAKTFRNPVLKMWVKKELLSYRAGITALSCALCAGGVIRPPRPRRAP